MKLGFVGPAPGDEALLGDAVALLLRDSSIAEVIYLGLDDGVDRVATTWGRQLTGTAHSSERWFLGQAARLAATGKPHQIEELLAKDEAVHRLSAIRKLPPAPARAIEMIDDRIVTVVFDKAVLDEEDIANAHLVVYGRSQEALLKQFGPRYFFTPGPLAARKLGVIEAEESGQIAVSLIDCRGTEIWRRSLQGRPPAKLTVTA